MIGLRRCLDPSVRAARRRAMEHVRKAHPSLRVTSARLRAEEPSRRVFAVFYEEAAARTIPARYKLVAVPRTGDAIEELETSPASPYWIRGRK